MPTGAQIRQDFIGFFKERDHVIVPSASLVPKNDPTLLFTNSGMVQFKDVFLGADTRSYERAVDSQKCMRVAGKHNDLDDVGRDDSHHTFFEMLGNWSFGDYYKEEAIKWAWQLLTEVWGMPPERLYATVFQDEFGEIDSDEDAANAWRDQPAFDPTHLFYTGRKDNFWEMADTGPCGPCSEIHVDLHTGSGPITRETLQTSRLVELWNLVFIQYNRRGPTQLSPLPNTHVDTGMGLERVTAILQKVESNYRTDLLWPLIDATQRLTGHKDAVRELNFTPYRVIADHARAAAFLIADGVTPGNTGRNYVCRMIIRRASRFGAEIGLTEPFLAEISETVIQTYAAAYKELDVRSDIIANTLTSEEARFRQTIDSGLAHLTGLITTAQSEGRGTLSGAETFNLYATYGLPVEISRDVAREDGLDVDHPGFVKALESHRVASGAGKSMGEISATEADAYRILKENLREQHLIGPEGVEHEPFGPLDIPAAVLTMVSKRGNAIPTARTGDQIGLVMAASPFYVEGGGQVADTGSITAADDRWKVTITEVIQPVAGLIVHFGTVTSGTPSGGDDAVVSVNPHLRRETMRNHTATHLLHRELRNLLGEQVQQAGSLVTPDRLRFDFQHDTTLTQPQIAQLVHGINQTILADHPIIISHESREVALERGATALFGEKYGDIVRSVQIGTSDSIYSLELCGGTHVSNTGQIGTIIVNSETSVAAGIRRIDAVTGRKAFEHIENSRKTLEHIYAELRTDPLGLSARLTHLLAAEADAEKARAAGALTLARSQFESALVFVKHVLGVPLMAAKFEVGETKLLRKITDWYQKVYPSGIVIVGAQIDSSARVVVRVSKDLLAHGLHAGDLAATISKKVGGQGGGNSSLAQGGGNQPDRLDAALAGAEQIVAKALTEHD